jgi:hypothetical protein
VLSRVRVCFFPGVPDAIPFPMSPHLHIVSTPVPVHVHQPSTVAISQRVVDRSEPITMRSKKLATQKPIKLLLASQP